MTLSEIEAELRSVAASTERKREALTAALASLKSAAVAADDQKAATHLWCLESILEIQSFYLDAFHCFKEKRYYDGWCLLERAEISLYSLKPHFTDENNEFQIERIGLLVPRFQSIFPYSWFMSPELVELEKKCNICNQTVAIRHLCGHRVGQIYNGILCLRIVTKMDVLGVAMVQSPVQKYSVPFLSDPETKEQRDNYNYDPVEYIVSLLHSPFDLWDVEKSERRMPHDRFRDVGRNSPCPCRSGKKYKNCCLRESGVLRPHYEFVLIQRN